MTEKRKASSRLNLMVLLLWPAVSLIFTSCASELSTRGSQVYMVPAVQIQRVESECQFLGSVTGSSFLWGGCCLSYMGWRDVAYHNALNELLDKAAEMGATHVFVNLGTGEGLRGDAYRCAYCQGPDGKPDAAHCQRPDGRPDVGYCVDLQGNRVGEARCDGAEGRDQAECEKNGGEWIPEIDERKCKKDGYLWVPEAKNPGDCRARGGIWVPVAKDQPTCEEKGGAWIISRDVVQPLPEEKDQ